MAPLDKQTFIWSEVQALEMVHSGSCSHDDKSMMTWTGVYDTDAGVLGFSSGCKSRASLHNHSCF